MQICRDHISATDSSASTHTHQQQQQEAAEEADDQDDPKIPKVVKEKEEKEKREARQLARDLKHTVRHDEHGIHIKAISWPLRALTLSTRCRFDYYRPSYKQLLSLPCFQFTCHALTFTASKMYS
jgi:hypothetical protein